MNKDRRYRLIGISLAILITLVTVDLAFRIWPGLVKSENRLVNAEMQPDGSVMLYGLDLRYAETPHFPGRAVVALASDPDPMTRTGQAFWVKDLALEYGFTDIDGSIPDAEKLHAQLKKQAPAFWAEVLGS